MYILLKVQKYKTPIILSNAKDLGYRSCRCSVRFAQDDKYWRSFFVLHIGIY